MGTHFVFVFLFHHTLSPITRKHNKQLVDSFPEMEMFRSKVRKFA